MNYLGRLGFPIAEVHQNLKQEQLPFSFSFLGFFDSLRKCLLVLSYLHRKQDCSGEFQSPGNKTLEASRLKISVNLLKVTERKWHRQWV